MSKRSRKRSRLASVLANSIAVLAGLARHIQALLPKRVPVEVVVVDRRRRRAIKREIARTIRHLQRLFGDQAPRDVVVLVQQVIPESRQLSGCCQVRLTADGRRFALIRIALQVNGRRLNVDDILAVLTEQYVGLASQLAEGRNVVVPVEYTPANSPEEVRAKLAPDPFGASATDGSASAERPAA